MARPFDFAVYGPDERVTTVVETKARGGTTDVWAAALRRNMIAHASVPRGAMFVLATPRVLYLWDPEVPSDDLPTYEIDAAPIFAPYFAQAGVPLGAEVVVDHLVFELIVSSWLHDLAATSGEQPALQASGLVDRIKRGRVEAELAA